MVYFSLNALFSLFDSACVPALCKQIVSDAVRNKKFVVEVGDG